MYSVSYRNRYFLSLPYPCITVCKIHAIKIVVIIIIPNSSLRSEINAVIFLCLCLLIANVLANTQKSNVWLAKEKTQTLTELVAYAIPPLKEMARPSPNSASRITESDR